jgi:hypothetical protein
MSTAVTTINQDGAAKLENALIRGDLADLKPEERVMYYNQVCKSLGLNPLTKPFAYLHLNGKTILYALKDCTEQLRTIHGISLTIPARESIEGVYVVTARATKPDGRMDESTGAVTVEGLKGEQKANALMKAETKAKRRVTLSICGLGMLDESEIESIPQQPQTAVDYENTPEARKQFAKIAQQEQQLIAEKKIEELKKEEPPKPKLEIPPAFQKIKDELGANKELILAKLSDMQMELLEALNGDAEASNVFVQGLQMQYGGMAFCDMPVGSLLRVVYRVWNKINEANRQKVVNELPMGVGADAPLWVSSPSEANRQGKDAHTSYVESEKGKRGRK